MHFSSGATSSDRMASKGRLTDRVVYGDEKGVPYPNSKVYFNDANLGSYYDYSEFPVVEGVTIYYS